MTKKRTFALMDLFREATRTIDPPSQARARLRKTMLVTIDTQGTQIRFALSQKDRRRFAAAVYNKSLHDPAALRSLRRPVREKPKIGGPQNALEALNIYIVRRSPCFRWMQPFGHAEDERRRAGGPGESR